METSRYFFPYCCSKKTQKNKKKKSHSSSFPPGKMSIWYSKYFYSKTAGRQREGVLGSSEHAMLKENALRSSLPSSPPGVNGHHLPQLVPPPPLSSGIRIPPVRGMKALLEQRELQRALHCRERSQQHCNLAEVFCFLPRSQADVQHQRNGTPRCSKATLSDTSKNTPFLAG